MGRAMQFVRHSLGPAGLCAVHFTTLVFTPGQVTFVT